MDGATHKYRILNKDDLLTISEKKHNFINCKGQLFNFRNNKQALIIAYTDKAELIKNRLENRKAHLLNELIKNNKSYLLIKYNNLASLKTLCNRHEIKAPKKIKKLLGLKDILL